MENDPTNIYQIKDKKNIEPGIFRAYDIRGIYPSQLDEAIAYRTARAMAEYYPKTMKIAVACDPRLSSPALSKAVIDGFLDSGKQVMDIGIAPDPLFYFSIFNYKYDGGIIISGSHNPKEYNGMTLVVKESPQSRPEDIIQEELQKIQKRVFDGKEFEKKERGKVSKIDPSTDYINYVSSRINLKRSLKIVVDTANGACGYLPEKVFKKLGCQVKTLYGDFDGSFPNHDPDPYEEENLKAIKETVLKEGADVGFAFDTDGDRVAPIDNQGNVVSGDSCMLMLAKKALQKKKGPLVHCMRISKAFLDEIAKEGDVKTYFSVSHHSAVIRKIIKEKAVFGGEVTYHLFFPLDYYLCDDALFASLKLAEIVSDHQDFSQYVGTLPSYHTSPEIFIETPDKEKFQIIENLQKYLKKNNYDFIDIDGARISFEHGWALARAANTSPFIKCRFEGDTKENLIEIEKKSLEIFKKVGIPITKKTYQELGL